MTDAYPPPLDQLLTLGEDAARADHWPDYLAMGLGIEHVPLLIRMATDRSLSGADEPQLWAPIHAWRTLGRLQAADAAEPLTSLLHEVEDWDWVGEELPLVFALIGPPAIPVLVRYLDQREHGPLARTVAADALKRIAESHPDSRDACVAALAAQLRHYATQDRALNGFLVGELLDLGAVDSAPGMEQAFAAGRVDISIAGDWEDAQVALGLLPARRTPRPNYLAVEGMALGAPAPPPPIPARGRERRRSIAKRRRKLARQSRRRNWRRK
ncbi:MAG TPA: hypothetical protein VFY16_11355 [Gemmatimonadaceae bacterium]|nr:hypothetical protein [Gemmatimonadaceae bacterium]